MSEAAGRSWLLTAPARLHFGLLAFGGDAAEPQHGGAGMMICQPAVTLAIRPAEGEAASEPRWLHVVGPRAERIRAFAARWWEARNRMSIAPCRIEVLQTPPEHAGFGSGTALALSVARLLAAWCGEAEPGPAELAAATGRARRSSIGTWGFARGGLLVEPGKPVGDTLAPLSFRCNLPEAWRVVLVRDPAAAALSGPAECAAFERLPPIPSSVTERLRAELVEQMQPAAEAGDCEALGESIYCYGRLAGECFAGVQGGPYHSEAVAQRVEALRAWGARGVGQSSWGPTVFALMPEEGSARELADRMRRAEPGLEVRITSPANEGARLTPLE